jgi:hypothetical protein
LPDLATLAQKPSGKLVSVPFQNDTRLNFGPEMETQNILDIQRGEAVGEFEPRCLLQLDQA